jgi:spermidine/putrescine transport system substrate-binding protein
MEIFKWVLVGVLAVSFFCLLLSGCTKNSKPKLYVYNWTYYIPDEVVKEFETRFNATVVYDMYASNEEMYAKLKAGGGGYDLVFPSGDYVSVMIKENMCIELDKSRIPNFSLLDTTILKKIKFDPECRFSVPYIMGAAGVTVNRKYVKEYVKSWDIFNRSDLKGRMTLLDDMREVLGAALIMDSQSVNSVDKTALEKAKTRVMQWRENIVKFDAESFGKGFAAGEFWVVQGYAENVFLELDSAARADADFFIPDEGSSMYIDNMVMLKNSKNTDLAYKFINFIHEPAVYAKIADFLMLPSINVEARKFRKVKPNYDIDDLQNSEFRIQGRSWRKSRNV